MTAAAVRQNDTAALLMALSRSDFSEKERWRAEDLTRAVTDWHAFTELAVRHGVAALAWQNLNDLDLARFVEEEERAVLESTLLRTIARVTFISSVAAEITEALDKAGIKALLLKGMALEHTVYGSRGLRQMSDADLLVSPRDVLGARDVIESLGFVSRPLKSPLYRHIILETGNHLPEMHRGGVSVDLHHRLFGEKAAGLTEKAFSEAVTVIAGDFDWHILPPRINFLNLVMHLQKHENKGEFQLRLYCDMFLLLVSEREVILTDELIGEARQAGIEIEVKVVLYLMKVIWELDVPDKFTVDAGRGAISTGRFIENLENPGIIEPLSASEVYRRNITAIRGLKGKLIFIAGDLFPSLTFMKNRYGLDSLWKAMLYYPHRLGKLFVALKALKKGKDL